MRGAPFADVKPSPAALVRICWPVARPIASPEATRVCVPAKEELLVPVANQHTRIPCAWRLTPSHRETRAGQVRAMSLVGLIAMNRLERRPVGRSRLLRDEIHDQVTEIVPEVRHLGHLSPVPNATRTRGASGECSPASAARSRAVQPVAEGGHSAD